MMRILLLTQLAVTGRDAGPKIKTYQVLEALAARHEIVYCSFVRDEREAWNAEQLQGLCERVVTVPLRRSWSNNVRFFIESLLVGEAFLLRRDEQAAMHTCVRALLGGERIDAIHVDQVNMMRFVPADWPGGVILDAHNAVWLVCERLRQGEGNLLKRWFLAREVRLLCQAEGEACRRAAGVLVVSEQDKRALCEVAGGSVPVSVVPIALDVGRYDELWEQRKQGGMEPGHVLTIGTMYWPPNSEGVQWWLREGYVTLQRMYAGAIYSIVGARPPRKLRALARRFAGVEVLGYVADIAPLWRRATLLAVPLLAGGGVRVKILEAMAMGVPVVTTTVGCEGLSVRHGEHLLIADTAQEFSKACFAILRDPQLARRLAENARQLMIEHYDAARALRPLHELYERIESSKVGNSG
jgi:glycosyltransferase involved in cell wall biosynthesis